MNNRQNPRILIDRNDIAATISRLAAEISRDYFDKYPLLIGILKGSFMFMADLVRLLEFPLEIDFIRLSSYGQGTESSGKVEVIQGLRSPVINRNILIIEDIIDTGLTTTFLMDYLSKEKPTSIRLCTLTDKPDGHKIQVHIDYLGMTVPDKFLVGYGLDCNEQYRNLPDICVLEED